MAELLTSNVIKTKELAELLRKAGLIVSDKNLSRLAKVYGIKQPNKVQVAYKDRNSKRIVDIKNPTQFYVKPTASQLKEIKKQYDINQLKAPGTTEAGRKAFEERKAYATKLLKSGKYTQGQVNELVKKKFPYAKSMTSTISELSKKIKNVPSGREGKTATLVRRVTDDLKKLNKSEVKTLLKNGNKNLEQLINKTSKILNTDKSLAARRIGQLIEAHAGDDRYIKLKDDLFLRRVGPLIEGLGKVEGSRLFGGIGGGLQRMAAERTVAKDLGKPRAFFASLRKRIQEIIPGGDYQTDEIKNIRSSARLGTSPYSAFIQGIRSDINQDKAKAFDKQTSIYEKRLQEANTFAEKKKIANEYNRKAKIFAAEANKDLKPGQPPVRTLEISFDKPDAVIKNKTALDNYGDLFDDIYKKHGYSFKVPADVKSVDEIRPFLEGGRGKGQMLKMLAQKAPRIFGIPAAAYLGAQALTGEAEAEESNIKYNPDLGSFAEVKDIDGVVAPTKVDQSSLLNWMSENPGTTAIGTGAAALTAKPVRKGVSTAARGLLKAIGPLGTPLGLAGISTAVGGYDLEDPVDRIGLEAELAFAKPLVGQSQQIAKGFKNPMVRRGVQQVLNLGMPAKFALRAARIATPLGLASLAAEGAYYGGKAILNEYNRRKSLSDEERAAEDAENEFDLMGSA